MQMKKSLFGLSAKVAMAVLAVCSFVLTSCYEKQAPSPKADPVYYVVGTVYDATTSEAISATVTVNSNAVTVSGGSFITKVNGAGAVTVTAEAEGYISVSRTVQVVPADYNQISVTTADIAMVPEGVELPEAGIVPANMTAEELIENFGFPKGTEVDEDGLIHVAHVLDIETHDGHVMSHTKLPYEVKDVYFEGYISDFKSNDPVVNQIMVIAGNGYLNSGLAGAEFADFGTKELKETVNKEGNCLLNVTVCHDFSQWILTYVFDGVVYTANCVKAESTTVVPNYDTHDSHDSHDNHGGNDSHDGHDGHNGHGGTNAGGGVVDPE